MTSTIDPFIKTFPQHDIPIDTILETLQLVNVSKKTCVPHAQMLQILSIRV